MTVDLDPGEVNTAALQVAGQVSQRLDARVIGIAARQLVTGICADGYVAGSRINQDRDGVERLVKAAEAEFRTALHHRANAIEWRSIVTFGSPVGYVADETTRADMLVTAAGARSRAAWMPAILQCRAGGRFLRYLPTWRP